MKLKIEEIFGEIGRRDKKVEYKGRTEFLYSIRFEMMKVSVDELKNL